MNTLDLTDMQDTGATTGNAPSGVVRDQPQLGPGVKEAVSKWQKKIQAAKKFFDKDFKRMREDMKVTKKGGSDEWVDSGNYTIPIIGRVINQAVWSAHSRG